METIKIGILGWGRVGRGIALALRDAPDMELCGIYTSRDPKSLGEEDLPVRDACDLLKSRQGLDVLFLAHGSKSALRDEAPRYARLYNCVDAFDIHAELSAHARRVHEIGLASGTLSVVGGGWDPGLLSVFRVYASSAFPRGAINTFWGRGVSAGHSEAIRSIVGVRDAVEYTAPREDARILAENGVPLDERRRHRRICYVVAAEEDRARIEREIRTMPHYFLGYDVEVFFVDEEELSREHAATPHRGCVMARAMTGKYYENRAELTLDLSMGCNGEYTAALLVPLARAVHTLYQSGTRGCLTPLEIPPAALLPPSADIATLW